MKVLKTITTPSQRIPEGADLADDLVLDGPLSRADWQRMGHLEGPAKPAMPARASRPVPEAPIEPPSDT